MSTKAILIGTFVLIFVCGAHAQTSVAAPDDEDLQSWNDIQITAPLTKRVDVFAKVTMRVGSNISRLSDGRFAFGYVWKPLKSLAISPYYMYVEARNSAGKFRIEHQLIVAATYKFPVKRFGLSHRSTFEERLKQPVNSWRYRGMLTVDKPLPERILAHTKVFVSDEVFYDSLLKEFSRNRVSVGISRVINKHLVWDLFYLRQNDGHSHPGDLNVIGQTWKIIM